MYIKNIDFRHSLNGLVTTQSDTFVDRAKPNLTVSCVRIPVVQDF